MAKFATFPTLYNRVLQLSITDLKKWGFLDPEQIKNGTINWSKNGNPAGSIFFQINTHNEHPHIKLDYQYKDEPRAYKIMLVSIPSNLGFGKIWYFLCPHTMKRCRKLYLIDGYFLHREAFTGCMYETQTQSKEYREIEKTFGAYFKADDLYSELNKKNFKKTYAGKPTKRYLRITKQIQKAEQVSYLDVKRLLFA